MDGGSNRVTITLDNEQAAKLTRLAKRINTSEGTLASALLSTALDQADPDPHEIVDMLDSIPSAFERARLGFGQAQRGLGTPLEDL